MNIKKRVIACKYPPVSCICGEIFLEAGKNFRFGLMAGPPGKLNGFARGVDM